VPKIAALLFLLVAASGCGVVGATASAVGTVGSAAVSVGATAVETAVDVVTYPVRD
jgi:hypothetical protein